MIINGIEFKIGSDPELFVYDKKAKKFISGHELIQGTKAKPYPVKKGAVQVDGTALEFNTEPAKTKKVFSNTVELVVQQLGQMIPAKYQLMAVPTAEFSKRYMDKLPEDVKVLGCDPDFNAYTGLRNISPNANVNYRTGAGHIHIGWTNVDDPFDINHMRECEAIVQALDIFLGVPSLLIDKDDKRRQLYGKAGAFRPKKYGVEYRVLSNFWVMDPLLREWVFDNTRLALSKLLNHKLRKHYNYAKLAIDNNSKAYTDWVLNNYRVPLPKGM